MGRFKILSNPLIPLRWRLNFTSTCCGLTLVYHSICILNVKAQEGAFIQEEALVGAISMIMETNGSSFAALLKTCNLEILSLIRGGSLNPVSHICPGKVTQPQLRKH